MPKLKTDKDICELVTKLLRRVPPLRNETQLVKYLEKQLTECNDHLIKATVSLIPSETLPTTGTTVLVTCTVSSFLQRALEVVSAARQRKKSRLIRRVIFLPLSWIEDCEEQLLEVAAILRSFGVENVSICFPLRDRQQNTLQILIRKVDK